MKMHTPIFIIGLLVLVTPLIGLPQTYEQIILGAYGIAILLLTSNLSFIKRKIENYKKTEQTETIHDQTETI